MLGNLTPTGRVRARVGIVDLIVAAAMSWDFEAPSVRSTPPSLAALTSLPLSVPKPLTRLGSNANTVRLSLSLSSARRCSVIEFYSHAGCYGGSARL